MADVLQTTALITIAQNYAGNVVRQINNTAVLLKILAPTFRRGEGAGPSWVAESSGAIGEAFTEGADPSNFGTNGQASAILSFGRYWAPWHTSGSAMQAAGTSRTPEANIRLWVHNLESSSEKLARTINEDIYVGNGNGANGKIVGLDDAIGDVANVYATIDRTTSAYWRPTVVDSGAAALTFAQVRADLAAIKSASGYKPDFAMVSGLTLNKIAALFDPQKQYVYSTQQMMVEGTTITLDGGVGAVKFDGCMFIEDVFCPANSIYYMNSRYVWLEYGDTSLTIPPGAADNAVVLGGLSDGFDTIPMDLMLEYLAKTGDSVKAIVKCYPQLVIQRPCAFGVRSNIG